MALNGGPQANNRARVKREPLAEINVTPFVDVMLVLLVIFMITAPMMTAGVNVDLPKATSKPIPGNDQPLTVAITKDGIIYLEKTQIKLPELGAKLAAIAGENKEVRIFVRGDKDVDYGRIMQVVGEINQGGYTKVSLITESGAGKK